MKDPSSQDHFSPSVLRSWVNLASAGRSSPRHVDSSHPALAPASHDASRVPPFASRHLGGFVRPKHKEPDVVDVATGASSSSDLQHEAQGPVVDPVASSVVHRFLATTRDIVLSSWINVLLVFVPIGIAAKAAHLSPIVVFVMNAIAIVPLAGLLSHATESVAKRMGDTIGALMNVTFGNAVELIIFIIALSQDQIRIVQASLLGSILANLLLILGMCFLVGGLRFREQIYNSTVTQMSACLLSLSVMSLLLPTAFHASFTSDASAQADRAVLQVSRGTSVILLLVYGLYLLFQLKSHAYMYQSTPQHIIDEESAPGPVAAWMDSSSSSDSSSDDSDGSSVSNTTAARIKRVMRAGRRLRKSSAGSVDTVDRSAPVRTPSQRTTESPIAESRVAGSSKLRGVKKNGQNAVAEAAEEADDEHETFPGSHDGSRTASIIDKFDLKQRKKEKKRAKKEAKKKRKAEKAVRALISSQAVSAATAAAMVEPVINEKAPEENEPRRVDFAVADQDVQTATKKPFTLHGLSNMRPGLPTLPRPFSQGVFSPPVVRSGSPKILEPTVSGPIPRIRYGIRRTNSLPDRLNLAATAPARTPSGVGANIAVDAQAPASNDIEEDDENISRTTAVVLLLVSTGLVALCAEFLVSSIKDVTTDTSLGETFVGLIILPIVGNAAEHVTAVTVARKNKMDLAIGVAVGSSIQIALFVTPFIVLLGWCMSKEMTLYFTLFETVTLFVSAFIVNFLVLDGRSNYLEGALLCAAYIIIAVASFFYPATAQQSLLGGNADAVRGVVVG